MKCAGPNGEKFLKIEMYKPRLDRDDKQRSPIHLFFH